MKKHWGHASWIALVCAIAQPAMAQDQMQAEADVQTTPDEPVKSPAGVKPRNTDAPEDSEAIVVTGSRLSSEFSGATPVQVLHINNAIGSASVAEVLARATAAAGSQQINNQLSATGAGGMVVDGGANVNTIGLRNLSAQRTLSLLNGRRITPSGTGSRVGPVDYNVIPSIAIDRVEVVTTGASSIYGSDAIGGVINVLARRGGDGFELNGFGRLTEAGGGRYFELAGYWGRNFDRGYINAAVEFAKQYELNMRDRPDAACAQAFVTDAESGDRADVRNPDGSIHCFNHNPTGVFFDRYWYGGAFAFNEGLNYPAASLGLVNPNNPNMAPLRDFVRVGRAGFPDTFGFRRDTSPAYDEADIISPLQRINAYISGGYQINDSVEAYFDVLYSNRKSSSDSWSFLFPILSPDNPNNTVADALAYASNGNTDGTIQPQIVRPYRSDQEVNYFQATLGIRGNFGGALSKWKYDLNTRFGSSKGRYGQTFYYNDRVAAASQSNVACDPSLITISEPTTCVSIPWLSRRFLLEGNWTEAERNFLEGYEYGHTDYDQFSIDGSVSGTLFTLPAGDVSTAVGFSFRSDSMDDRPGYNAQNYNYFAFSTAGRTKGDDSIKEVFGEIGIPILADQPFFQRLSLTASGRYTHYQSYGSGTTYRVSGVWEPIRELTLRASYGTSFRAPSLYELNLANQTSYFGYFDPCVRYGESSNQTVIANCRAEGLPDNFTTNGSDITAIAGGGKGRLKAETSRNLNLGIVIRPGFANLMIALDYYDIDVRNQVSSFGVNNIIGSCYRLDQGRETFCNRITRDSVTNAISEVDNRLLNLSRQHVRGLDFAMQFKVPLSNDLGFGFDLRGSRTFENTLTRDALSDPEDRNGYSGNPKLTGNAEARLEYKDVFTLYLGADYVGSVDDEPYYRTFDDFYIDDTDTIRFYGPYSGRNVYGNSNDFAVVREKLSASAQVTFYTSMQVRLTKSTNLTMGVSNLLDKRPPVIGPDSYTYRIGSIAGNQYNMLGRSFFARIKQKF